MDGSIDSDEFIVAERLRMTVGELRVRMANNEYHQWRAFYRWRAAQEEVAIQEAKASRGR
jgi:hypothetical protein